MNYCVYSKAAHYPVWGIHYWGLQRVEQSNIAVILFCCLYLFCGYFSVSNVPILHGWSTIYTTNTFTFDDTPEKQFQTQQSS